MTIQIDFIRHGQCLDQAFLRGRTDSQLSEFGLCCGLQSVDRLIQPTQKLPAGCFLAHSPALRCQQLAQAIDDRYSQFALSADLLDHPELWQERDFGVLDGLSYAQAERDYPQVLAAYLQAPFDYTPPGGETLAAFTQRLKQAWQNFLQRLVAMQAAFEELRVVIVTHAGVMRWLFAHITGAGLANTFHLQIGYSAILSVEVIPLQTPPIFDAVEHVPPFVKLTALYPSPSAHICRESVKSN